jgi:5-methylcytosine-specific restriction enzyme A
MKMGNLAHHDPETIGDGLAGGGKLDKVIWNEFGHRPNQLRTVAEAIRLHATTAKVSAEPWDQEDEGALEGAVLMRAHRSRERNAELSRRKKRKVLELTGRLACEVCSFDFKATYGDIGDGFAECHHRTPLSQLNADAKTYLKDLALVCANCHRMLHRMNDPSDLVGLRNNLEESAHLSRVSE